MATRGHGQMVALPAGTAIHHSSGGSSLGKLISALLGLALVIGAIYVALRFGWGTLMDIADPTGRGQPIMTFPLTGARLPNVMRNIGLVAAGVGLMLRILHWTDEHGSRAVVFGLVVAAVGIFGPVFIDWIVGSGQAHLNVCLNHPEVCFPNPPSGQ